MQSPPPPKPIDPPANRGWHPVFLPLALPIYLLMVFLHHPFRFSGLRDCGLLGALFGFALLIAVERFSSRRHPHLGLGLAITAGIALLSGILLLLTWATLELAHAGNSAARTAAEDLKP